MNKKILLRVIYDQKYVLEMSTLIDIYVIGLHPCVVIVCKFKAICLFSFFREIKRLSVLKILHYRCFFLLYWKYAYFPSSSEEGHIVSLNYFSSAWKLKRTTWYPT